MLGICVGVSAILVGAQGFAQTQGQFLVLRALSFGFSAGLIPIIASMVAQYASDKNRTWFLSLLKCGYPFGWFFASLVVAVFAGLGWRTIFMVGFVVAPLALLFTWSLPKGENASRDEAESGDGKASLRTIFSGPFRNAALAYCGAFFCYGLASGAIVYLMDRADPALRGSIMGLCGSACVNAGFLVSPLVTTRLVEAIGWHWMYTLFVGSALVLCGLFFFLVGLQGKRSALS